MIEADLSSSSDSSDDLIEYQRGISDGFNETGASDSGKNRKLYCFACHRSEYHYNALRGTSYHHLLVGFTFGLALLFGPYRCRCCGYRRLCRYNFLNPRYHYHAWKFSGAKNPPSSNGSKKKSERSSKSVRIDDRHVSGKESDAPNREVRRRRKKKKNKTLKAVPYIDSIARARREREDRERLEQYSGEQTAVEDYSIEGLMGSFETEESRKERLNQIEEARALKDPFVGRKAKPRKKIKGKPKRRYAKKTRLSGPKIYCFRCHQNNEHFHILKGTGYYFFLFGISFGLAALFGPFRCSCCSKKRLWGANFLNPKYYFREWLGRGGGGYG